MRPCYFFSLALLGLISTTPDVFSEPAPAATAAPTPAPAKPAPAPPPPPELVLLTGVPHMGTEAEIRAYAAATRPRAKAITDPVLRNFINLTLAKLEDNPANSRTICEKHVRKLGDYFFTSARASLQNDPPDIDGAEKATLLAIRCNPAHLSARFLLSQIVFMRHHNPIVAAKVLGEGFHFVDVANHEIAYEYLKSYFSLLETGQADNEVLEAAKRIFADSKKSIPGVHEITNSHAAIASNWLGRYDDAIAYIRKSGLKNASSRILEARALFYKGDTKSAVSLLYKAASENRAGDRDAILGQIVRFFVELGQVENALKIAAQRINEFPANPAARVHRLYLLDVTGDTATFKKELAELFNQYSANMPALLSLATFAAERAHPEIVEHCLSISQNSAAQNSGPTADANRILFGNLLVEALIRAKRPQEALNACKLHRLEEPAAIRETKGSIHALRAAAYFALGDRQAARVCVDKFLTEIHDDPATLAHINRLREMRDGRPATGNLPAIPPVAENPAEKYRITEEINRLVFRPRIVPPQSRIAIARLFRLAGATADGLILLEGGVRDNPTDGQLLGEYITTRIACNETAAVGSYRRALTTDIAALLKLRRPSPKVWNEVYAWLSTPAAAADPAAAALLPQIQKLIRPDLKGMGLF